MVTLALPGYTVHSHPMPPPPRLDPDAAPLRVLVLEDNDEDYQTLRRFLTPLALPDAQVVWVTTVAEAMAFLASGVFDVCLVDLHLPDGHGLQLVQWLTDERPEVAIVVMTGDEHPETDTRALVAGADYFLSKSEWSAMLVPRAVRYAVEQRRRMQKACARAKGSREPLPICMDCKKIRDEYDYWHALEEYLQRHAGLEFSHGFCPDCYRVRLAEVRQLTATQGDGSAP